jgi:hypothetical protein
MRSFTSIPSLGKALLVCVLALATATSHAGAQAPAALDGKAVLVVRDAFLADMDKVHEKIVALANAIPEDKYDWKPAPEVRTVSNALMHVAVEWYFGLPLTVGGTLPAELGALPAANAKLMAVTTKKDVLEQLDKAWSYGRAQVVAATDAQLLAARMPMAQPPLQVHSAVFLMAGDLHEHLGQLITYARSLGVKPPWSR